MNATHIERYEYPREPEPPPPAWPGFWEPESEGATAGESGPLSSRTLSADAGVEAHHKRNEGADFETGRRQGVEEGRLAERQALLATRAGEEKARAAHLASLIAAFTKERDQYLQTIEHEVVELSLAIAARILRREAQMDPLLLTGAVRVALGQLAENTQVRLRVPDSEAELWRETISHLPQLTVKTKVIPTSEMRLGDCVVETDLGSVDLGIRAQLAEIERGFFDRPGDGSCDQKQAKASRLDEIQERGE